MALGLDCPIASQFTLDKQSCAWCQWPRTPDHRPCCSEPVILPPLSILGCLNPKQPPFSHTPKGHLPHPHPHTHKKNCKRDWKAFWAQEIRISVPEPLCHQWAGDSGLRSSQATKGTWTGSSPRPPASGTGWKYRSQGSWLGCPMALAHVPAFTTCQQHALR